MVENMAFRRMPRQTESQEKGGKGKLTTDPSVHVPVSTQSAQVPVPRLRIDRKAPVISPCFKFSDLPTT